MPLPTTFAGVSSRGEGQFNYVSAAGSPIGYVANYGNQSVDVINLSDGTEIAKIPVPCPQGMVLDQTGSYLYVISGNSRNGGVSQFYGNVSGQSPGSGGQSIYLIDAVNFWVISVISPSETNIPAINTVVVHPNNKTVFYVDNANQKIVSLTMGTTTVSYTANIGVVYPQGGVFNNSGSLFYFLSGTYANTNIQLNSLPVDTGTGLPTTSASNALSGLLGVLGTAPLWIDPTGTYIYATAIANGGYGATNALKVYTISSNTWSNALFSYRYDNGVTGGSAWNSMTFSGGNAYFFVNTRNSVMNGYLQGNAATSLCWSGPVGSSSTGWSQTSTIGPTSVVSGPTATGGTTFYSCFPTGIWNLSTGTTTTTFQSNHTSQAYCAGMVVNQNLIKLVAGESLYYYPGTYQWTCPAGVTSVSVVCIGGSGVTSIPTAQVMYPQNNPSTTLSTTSYFLNTSTVAAGGNSGYFLGAGTTAGSVIAGTGYSGGAANSGGGGAGGYGGAGGAGGTSLSNGSAGGTGAGGGGYGGGTVTGYRGRGSSTTSGGPGGGVSPYGGSGPTINGATIMTGTGGAGAGGAGGSGSWSSVASSAGLPWSLNNVGGSANYSLFSAGIMGAFYGGGLLYGGGGALAYANNISVTPGTKYNLQVGFANGCVRIIWPGTTRSFNSGTGVQTWPLGTQKPVNQVIYMPGGLSAGSVSGSIKFTTSMVNNYHYSTTTSADSNAYNGIFKGPDGGIWSMPNSSSGVLGCCPSNYRNQFSAMPVSKISYSMSGGNAYDSCVAPDGTVYVLDDLNKRIGKIIPSITNYNNVNFTSISSVAGSSLCDAICIGPDNNIYFGGNFGSNNVIGKMTPNGTVSSITVSGTYTNFYINSLVAASDGNVYGTNGYGQIIKVNCAAGTASAIINVCPDSYVSGPTFTQGCMAVGPDNNLYWLTTQFYSGGSSGAGSLTSTNNILKLVPGNNSYSVLATGAFPSATSLYGMCWGPNGNIYIGGSTWLQQISSDGQTLIDYSYNPNNNGPYGSSYYFGQYTRGIFSGVE